MAAIDHWHPILLSRELGRKPVLVTLCGEDIVLFRTQRGQVGALEDRCPHRSMRLSKGWVDGGRIVCPYHSWSYDCSGRGESPGSPKLRAQAVRFDVEERYGAIWVKAAESNATIPTIEYPGHRLVCRLHKRVKTPFEVLLDNFTEIEHTPHGHAYFGFGLDDIRDVRTELEVAEDWVRVTNTGPQRKIPWVAEQLLGIRTGDPFTYQWTTFFSPVWTDYYMWWHDPATGERRQRGFSGAAFFTPINERETSAVIWYYITKSGLSALRETLLVPVRRLLLQVLGRMFSYEFYLDQQLVENVRDSALDLRAHQLGRFDRALIEQRKRVGSIYRGIRQPAERSLAARSD